MTKDAGCRGGARRERRKLEIVAAVEREFQNALIFDDRAERGVVGFDKLSAGLDFDDFRNVAHLQANIKARRLGHLQLDVGAHLGCEALHFDAQRVGARWECG